MATIYTAIDSNKRRTFVLIFLFLLFIIVLGWVFSYAFDAYFILPLAVIVAVFQALISYYYADKITLAISGAREIKREENPTIHRLVENLAITAGLPKPKIYLIDDTAPNAFATGRDPKHASITITRGLVLKLNKPELEGVLAHELSHVGNYDIRLLTVVVVLVGVVALLSDWFLRWTWFGGGRGIKRDDRGGEGGQLQLIMFLIAIVLAILAPLAAVLIQLAISRKREFLADSTGALLTRYPEGLASALEKISQDREPLEVANKATAHLYIVNPLKEHAGKTAVGWFSKLFSTHPPIEERIKALRSML